MFLINSKTSAQNMIMNETNLFFFFFISIFKSLLWDFFSYATHVLIACIYALYAQSIDREQEEKKTNRQKNLI